MTGLLDIPAPYLLLLPLTLAAGVDLFLTLLLITTLNPGWIPGDAMVQGPLWWVSAGLLAFFYLLETGLELRPFPGLLWHNLQLVMRPLAASLLAFVMLEDPWAASSLPIILSAGIIGAFSHVMSWGGKLRRFLSPKSEISGFTHAMAEDTLVLALLVLAMEVPDIAFLLSLGLLLVGVVAGGSRHHLTRFGLFLLQESLRGIVSRVHWKETSELPGWIRRWCLREGALGVSGLRAGTEGWPRPRAFRDGWLLQVGSGFFLAFRLSKGPVLLSLEGARLHPPTPLPLAQRILVEAPDGSEWALFLHPDAMGPKSHK